MSATPSALFTVTTTFGELHGAIGKIAKSFRPGHAD